MLENPIIRKFSSQDRSDVRRISCETAFPESKTEEIFSDNEVLADALTLYFTDYEPQSCFVAELNKKVIGYIIGTKDSRIMGRVFNQRIIKGLILKAIKRGVFFKLRNLKFFFFILISLLKGEFSMPDFAQSYPAMLHINLDKGFRGQKIGTKLIERFLGYLREEKVVGVHFGTISEGAKDFFAKIGFDLLFQGRRSYLKPYLGKELNFYIFGKIF